MQALWPEFCSVIQKLVLKRTSAHYDGPTNKCPDAATDGNGIEQAFSTFGKYVTNTQHLEAQIIFFDHELSQRKPKERVLPCTHEQLAQAYIDSPQLLRVMQLRKPSFFRVTANAGNNCARGKSVASLPLKRTDLVISLLQRMR